MSVRPFLKWPGNKFSALIYIVPQLSAIAERTKYDTLIEPFVGSGAVFLNTNFSRYCLTDLNADVISLYQYLQREGEKFVRYARRWFVPQYNDADMYYMLRADFNDLAYTRRRAALFLYLNRHGYNGLCRYNSRNGFNVPFGRYRKPYFPEQEMLRFYAKAQLATFVCSDYATTMRSVPPRSIIYCDPPYLPLSKTAQFTNYTARFFTERDQAQLAELAVTLSMQEIAVLISNHDIPLARQLYKTAIIKDFLVPRRISCDTTKRKAVRELLAIYCRKSCNSAE